MSSCVQTRRRGGGSGESLAAALGALSWMSYSYSMLHRCDDDHVTEVDENSITEVEG